MRFAALLPVSLLVACNPPAAEDYVARVGGTERATPLPPILTPDTTGAGWAPSPANPRRLIYGKPGQRLLFALECGGEADAPIITYSRFADADPHALAILALVGNGHVSRLKIDATRENNRWFWRGSEPAESLNFEGLTGARQVEATVPGAGSLILNPSPLPGELIRQCRLRGLPTIPASAPAATAEPLQSQPDTTDTAAPPPPPEQ